MWKITSIWKAENIGVSGWEPTTVFQPMQTQLLCCLKTDFSLSESLKFLKDSLNPDTKLLLESAVQVWLITIQFPFTLSRKI